ncbi:UDP-N-acetylmuramate--L-alanine ligase [Patulibacter sp.]|uniref:UDP-N-acetylmuramate--L-alanine ligase n=1 Tax=Patulibacter sp. TaxID=1912859 RepID=UPI00271563E5|nr:UDP-N-acetylmuramate--L-alanine ligase [Patulibacter sp.]MDO9410925.1 UDP-N-acetylmuramate--L-alanine ligase [Patulibacter sp.]
MSSAPWSGRRLHVLGIAGAGMSALAVLAKGLGAEVTGSDRGESRYLAGVREAGIPVSVGHDAANVPDGDDLVVVSSTAIPEDNPERAEARRRGLPDRSRHQLLREVCAEHRVIAVAGAHGKTTTSAMVVHALQGAGEDPSYLVGGILHATGHNVHVGTSGWLVVEADESDRSFLETHPEVAVVTSVELDHHGTYEGLAGLEDAFREFLGGARHRVVWDRPSLDRVLDGDLRAGSTHRYDAAHVDVIDAAQRFEVRDRADADPGTVSWDGTAVTLGQPGLHNAWNAAAAVLAAAASGADVTRAAAALATFPGTGRRFDRVGTGPAGSEIVDDYAHHPTEVAATIRAARTLRPGRVVAVFQPHLFSRTQMLAAEFGAALAEADLVCVLDVYPARERAEDFSGVTGLTLARTAADAADGRPIVLLPTIQDALERLPALLREGDLVLCMGAGDVDAVARGLVAAAG